MTGDGQLDKWIDEWIQGDERKLRDWGGEETEDGVKKELAKGSLVLAASGKFLYLWEPHSSHL